MPKALLNPLPLSGLFAVAKPSGPTSMSIINDIKQLICSSRLFVEAEKLEKLKERGKTPTRRKYARDTVKIGQGGTLDPLADGVLVIGVGKGTRQLSEFLDCVKEYRTTALLGCETDTYDSEGMRVRSAPWRHVTKDAVEKALEKFRGEISQTPPIFSALKMDGKPLYEYARKGIPLPRPIEKRNVTVHSLEILEWKGTDHGYRWPEKKMTQQEKQAMETALKGIQEDPASIGESDGDASDQVPAAFVLSMKVSGGTYVRSIVHDLGHALGSAAHVVTLTRSRQGRFTLDPNADDDRGCISWDVFKTALEDEEGRDGDGWTEWENEVIANLEVVEGKMA